MGQARTRSWWRVGVVLMGLALLATACPADESEEVPAAPDEDVEEDVGVEQPDVDDPVDEEFPQINWRYTSAVPEGSTIEGGATWWMEEIERRTGGQATVEPFYAGSLITFGEELTSLQEGAVDIGHIVQAPYASQFPLLGVGTIVFVTGDPVAGLWALEALVEENEHVAREFTDNGLKLLYFKPVAPFAMGSPDPIETLEDFQGTRFRTLGPLPSMAYQAVGIDPVEMAITEAYDAISRGTITGWGAAAVELSVALGLHELTTYIFDPGFGHYMPVANAMSMDAWEALPPHVQQLIEELNEEQYDVALDLFQGVEEGLCEPLEEVGAEAYRLSDAEVERWRDLVFDDLVDRWKGMVVETGTDEAIADEVLEHYISLVERYEAESTFASAFDLC